MAELPVWQPAGDVPAPEPRGDGSGRVLAIVASEQAAADGWAPAAAAGLAHRWASEGHRIALVDAGLDQPSLHETLGLANREGLTDAALHGASLERVSQPVADGLFLFVSAGTPVANGAAVVQSPRWYRITDGMLEAGVTLLVYLREGDAASTAFLGAAADVLVLAGPDDELTGISADVVPLVRAVTGGKDAIAALTALSTEASATLEAPSTPDDPSTYASDAADMGGFGGGGSDMPAWATPPTLVDAAPDGPSEELGRSDDLEMEPAEVPQVADPTDDAPSDSAKPMAAVADAGEPDGTPSADDVGTTNGDLAGSAVRVAPDKGSGGGVTTLLFVLLVIAVATALGWMLSSGAG